MPGAAGFAAVLALGAGSAPVTETVAEPPVQAELRYTRTSYPRNRDGFQRFDHFSDMRMVIKRDDAVVYEASLYDRRCRERERPGRTCHPANRLAAADTASSLDLRDLDRDGENEVIAHLRLGDERDRCYTIFYGYTPPTYTPLKVVFEEPCYVLRELNDDLVPELVHADAHFTGRFSKSPVSLMRPLRISRYDRGRLVDVTREFPQELREERDRLWRTFLHNRTTYDGNLGLLAAWAADEYRLGRRAQALAKLRRLNRAGFLRDRDAARGQPRGAGFIRRLDRYLRRRGYA